MTHRIATISLCLLLVFIASAFRECRGKFPVAEAVRIVANEGEGQVLRSRDVQQGTPAGTNVYGYRPVSAETLALIDTGLAGAFVDARVSGYSQMLSHGSYDVYTPPYDCIPSPEQRIPSFLLRADSYDATIFDQHNSKGPGKKDGRGVVFAAEMVLNNGHQGRGEMYACPDTSVIRDGARHGAEHIIIAVNDNDYYNLTWYHGNGFYHPLLPKREGRGEFHQIVVDGKVMAVEVTR